MDETKNNETNSTTSYDEWSGTPFQGRTDSENEQAGAQVEEAQQMEAGGAESEEPAATEPVAADAGEQVAEPEDAAAPVAEVQEQPRQSIDYNRTFRSLTEGDVVKGVVVHIDKEGVLVDVGTKSEGLIRPNELSRDSSASPEDVVTVGESIDVYVMQSENQDGNLILSKKRADFEQAWERVEEAANSQKVVTAMVTDRVKGGLVVDLGIRGFVPASHVASGKVKNLDKFIGQSLPLRVIEVDRERRKVVLSNRLAVEHEREKARAATVATLAEGQVRAGIVRRITDYGAFVDLGGIDGLLHISEMSWTRIKHPSEVVKVGDKIQVMVLKLDLNQGKVSLGLRQILPDPWAELSAKFHVGDVIKGTVTRLVPFGAFVQVEGGIEGIIPNSELAHRRVNKPEDVVSVDQEVEIKVIDLRPEERRMTLSLRQLQPAPEREPRERPEMPSYASYNREEPKTTIGDLVGDMIREARTARREKKRKVREAEERIEGEEIFEDVTEAEALAEPMFDTPEVEETETAEAPEAEVQVEEPAAEAAEVAEEPAVEAEAPAEVAEAVEETDQPAAEAEETTVVAEEPAAAEEASEETEA